MTPSETPRRKPGRPPRPGGPTQVARELGLDRRSSGVTFGQGLRTIREDGNDELAREIKAAMQAAVSQPDGGGERGWGSGVEVIARFEPSDQRWAWEQLQARGVRWLKRYIETQRNPPTDEELAERLAAWLDREYPQLDGQTIGGALKILRSMIPSESD